MMISGALAGLAGTGQILGVLDRASPGFNAGLGFDGIAVALLGRSNPFGVVLAALLFGGLNAGGQYMQANADVGIDLISRHPGAHHHLRGGAGPDQRHLPGQVECVRDADQPGVGS